MNLHCGPIDRSKTSSAKYLQRINRNKHHIITQVAAWLNG